MNTKDFCKKLEERTVGLTEIVLYIVGIILAAITAWLTWKGLKKKGVKESGVEPPQTQHQEQQQTVNIIIPPTPTKKEKPKKSPSKRPRITQKIQKKNEVVDEELMDEWIDVPSGGHAKITERFEAGDILEGVLEEQDNYEFDYYLFDVPNYVKYKNNEEFFSIDSDFDKANYHINVKIPESGEWCLVLDLYRKQYDRLVHTKLVRKRG